MNDKVIYIEYQKKLLKTSKGNEHFSLISRGTITTIKNPANCPERRFISQTFGKISESLKALPHGNSTKSDAKQYLQASRDTAKSKLESGMEPKRFMTS